MPRHYASVKLRNGCLGHSNSFHVVIYTVRGTKAYLDPLMSGQVPYLTMSHVELSIPSQIS
jgi:hypothetical protein